ncbi:MAG: PEP-CTERM sorting domain-containing protein [Leptolyngbya sp. Prado105]|jgi:hypothetical protein|nr:PEP-CTERM sorting domain-containing protein [Leptolyngbya sp. Prado105]
MKFVKGLVSVAAVSAIAVISHAGSAQAISFSITGGATGPGGVTNQGAFSDLQLPGTRTVDFNSGSAPTTGFAKYSFQNASGSSNVRSDVWSPAGVGGAVNDSKYLAVFAGNDVTIDLEGHLDYFGINWGAMSPGNTFSFFDGGRLIKTVGYTDVNPLAEVRAAQHGNEGNGYVHFSTNQKNEFFNRIVISQIGGGGFESDNHSFRMASVPEPTAILGLSAVAGALLLKRKKQVQTEE